MVGIKKGYQTDSLSCLFIYPLNSIFSTGLVANHPAGSAAMITWLEINCSVAYRRKFLLIWRSHIILLTIRGIAALLLLFLLCFVRITRFFMFGFPLFRNLVRTSVSGPFLVFSGILILGTHIFSIYN